MELLLTKSEAGRGAVVDSEEDAEKLMELLLTKSKAGRGVVVVVVPLSLFAHMTLSLLRLIIISVIGGILHEVLS
jgi:hypothetical protein